jgi:hypothetical protein
VFEGSSKGHPTTRLIHKLLRQLGINRLELAANLCGDADHFARVQVEERTHLPRCVVERLGETHQIDPDATRT